MLRTSGNMPKPMIHERGVVDAASPSRAAEQAAVTSAFASDVRTVLDAARPFESTLAMLGELAIVNLDAALREAAGRPLDARWRIAFFALDEFVVYYIRHSTDSGESRSFERLSSFLAENADLGQNSLGARD